MYIEGSPLFQFPLKAAVDEEEDEDEKEVQSLI